MALIDTPLTPDPDRRGFAKIARYSSWKDRPTAHRVAQRYAPLSPYQLSIATLHAWLGRQWYTLSASERQTWQDKADLLGVVITTVWFAWATDRFTAGAGPSRTWPPTPTYDEIAINSLTATPHPGRATILVAPADNTALWAMLLARSAAEPVTPRLHTLVAVVNPTATAQRIIEDSPLRPGTYTYSAACLLIDGTTGPWLDATSIEIT